MLRHPYPIDTPDWDRWLPMLGPADTSSAEEDRCSELEEEDYQDALLRFLGPETPAEESEEALAEQAAYELAALRDPLHPRNLTRYHPLHDDRLDCRCLLTGQNGLKQVYVLISAWRLTWAQQWRWHVNTDKGGGRYPRRTQSLPGKKSTTIYLYREIMRQMLVEDELLRHSMLAKFGLVSRQDPAVDADHLLAVGIVHHRNHDPEDNQDSNLELVTPEENRRQAKDQPGAGGYVGVRRVSRLDDAGQSRWAYQALVTVAGPRNSRRRKVLGTYQTPELALLVRVLWLMAHPKWLCGTFTPTEAEAHVWQQARRLVKDPAAILCHHFGALAALPPCVQRYLLYARLQSNKGRIAIICAR